LADRWHQRKAACFPALGLRPGVVDAAAQALGPGDFVFDVTGFDFEFDVM